MGERERRATRPPRYLNDYVVDWPPSRRLLTSAHSCAQPTDDEVLQEDAAPKEEDDHELSTSWARTDAKIRQLVGKIDRNRAKACELMESSGSKTVIKLCHDRINAAWVEVQTTIDTAAEAVNDSNKVRVDALRDDLEIEVEEVVDAIIQYLESTPQTPVVPMNMWVQTSTPARRELPAAACDAPPRRANTPILRREPEVTQNVAQHANDHHQQDPQRDDYMEEQPDDTTYNHHTYTEDDADDDTWTTASTSDPANRGFATAMNTMSCTLERLLCNSDLPKEATFIFDGVPWKYLRFVKNFNERVGDKPYSNAKKMNQLVLCTCGKAREAIEMYQGMDDGYITARRVLKERYGQPYQIVKSCIERLTNNTRLKGNDYEGIQKFSDMLAADYQLLKEMKLLHEADTQTTLRAIFQQLPPGLQSKWVERVNQLEDQPGNQQPKLKDLVQFVKNQVKRSSHPVYQITSTRIDSNTPSVNTQNSRPVQYNPPRSRSSRSTFSAQRTPSGDNPVMSQQRVPNSRPYNSFNRVGQPSVGRDSRPRGSDHVHQQNTSSTQYSSQRERPVERDRRPIVTCEFCQRSHRTTECPLFEMKDGPYRRQFAIDKRLCFACAEKHLIRHCLRRDDPCPVRSCNGKHHRLFCSRSTPENINPPSYDEPPRNESVHRQTSAFTSDSSTRHAPETEPPTNTASIQRAAVDMPKVLLRVVPVRVTVHSGKSCTTFALLDGGSTTTLMSQAFADQLSLCGKPQEAFFDTVFTGNQSVKIEVAQCRLTALPGHGDPESPIQLRNVEIVPTLHIDSRYIQYSLDLTKWDHLKNLSTDVEVDVPSVSLCIGQDNPRTQLIIETRYGTDISNEPYAVRTPFGWTIAGPTKQSPVNPVVSFVAKDDATFGQNEHYCCPTETPEVESQLRKLERSINRLWDAERHGFSDDGAKTMSEEDKFALATLQSSCTLVNNQYQVAMLWRSVDVQFPSNSHVARRCLSHIVRKFRDRPEFERMYRHSMQNYITKGYAVKMTPEEASIHTSKTWYLSHHGVENPTKPGKVRVVKNAALEVKGTSLNNQLLHGPDINNSLIGVLFRFRKGAVAINADIEEMFLRVLVPTEDSDALRFYWWSEDQSVEDPPSTFRMTRHIFGAKDSPCSCVFALQQCARDNVHDFDEDTIQTVLNNFYVDDVLKAVSSVEQGIELASQLMKLLERGGFNLVKFVSNKPRVLSALPPDKVAPECREIVMDMENVPTQRALGLKWNIDIDTFGIKITLCDRPNTRRGCMSFLCAITDPFGIMAPVLLIGKRILQETCRRNLTWDDALPSDLLSQWEKWKSSLLCLDQLTIPRCFPGMENTFEDLQVELHTFGDASEYGYGVVSYLRVTKPDGTVHVSFVMGKSRTAPLRHISIPRLEFQASTVCTRVSRLICRELGISPDNVRFWTDSTIALQYIKNTTRRFKTFVANRKEEILDFSTPEQWHHCRSQLNPADIASRGAYGQKLLTNKLWLNGPSFLGQSSNTWPVMPIINSVSDDDPEVKRTSVIATTAERDQASIDEFVQRFSTWDSLLRCTGWLKKFAAYVRAKAKNAQYPVRKFTVADLNAATESLVRLSQQAMLNDELQRLSRNEPVRVTSPISQLRPVLIDMIIRIGGRLGEAPLSYKARHPMIVPKQHHIATLLVRHYHSLVAHSGPAHTLALLRETFWIPDAKSVAKKICHACIQCRKLHARVMTQTMADLPAARVTPYSPPFSETGVDCFGPLMVKRGRTEVKRYGLIATCLATRAVHLEVLETMNTDSFLNGMRRFMARRGQPDTIWCDNGSNMVGGCRELRRSIKEWNQSQIDRYLVNRQITWHFQTPVAPHMSGVWERLVKSTKTALKAILGKSLVGEEVLRTTLAEVEAVLNSRPITANSDDVTDYEALTPNHLLLQRRVDSLPPGIFDQSDMYRRKWRQVQFLVNQFWKRWIKDYLPGLQYMSKWRRPQRNVAVGDLVLIAEKNVLRGHWPLARVVAVDVGRDQRVRTVDVKTHTGIYRRPIHTLCLLEAAVRIDSDSP